METEPHKNTKIDWCRRYNQGWVYIKKNKNNTFFVCCDECYLSYNNPVDYFTEKNGYTYIEDTSYISVGEIPIDWNEYILKGRLNDIEEYISRRQQIKNNLKR